MIRVGAGVEVESTIIAVGRLREYPFREYNKTNYYGRLNHCPS